MNTQLLKIKLYLTLTGLIPINRKYLARVQLANIKVMKRMISSIDNLTMLMNSNKQFIMLMQFKVDELEAKVNNIKPPQPFEFDVDENNPAYR